MKIIKKKSEFGLNIFLEEKNITLAITFGGNGDLYWSIRNYNKDIEKEERVDSFYITKENYELYFLFEKLYEDIKEINLFESFEENKDLYRRYGYDNYHELFDEENKTITWYSDETAHEVANYLKIVKEDNRFKIEFYTQEYKKGYDPDFNSLYYIPVRFSTSGSRYGYFYIPFMEMYQGLKKVEDANEYGHQIHMEEYLYEKEYKKVLKK